MSDRSEILSAIHETGGAVEGSRVRGGNLSRVAHKLGVARKTLYNRMRRLGLKGTSGRPRKRLRRRQRVTAGLAAAAALALGVVVVARGRKA